MKTEWWAMGLTVCATLVGASASLFLKIGADRSSRKLLEIVMNPWILIGIFLFLMSTPFFLIALRGGELSSLYPMLSLSYVWVILLSKLILGERININKVLNIALIMTGVILVGISGR